MPVSFLYVDELINKNPVPLKSGPPLRVKPSEIGMPKPTQIMNPISQPSIGGSIINPLSKNIGPPPMRVGPSSINPLSRPPTPGETRPNTSNNEIQFDTSQVPYINRPIVDSIMGLLPILDQIEVKIILEMI